MPDNIKSRYINLLTNSRLKKPKNYLPAYFLGLSFRGRFYNVDKEYKNHYPMYAKRDKVKTPAFL